tara:strand:- start:4 stop:312 length:309 start_codon:yes stop_codon:yes gene_type:complete
MRILRAEEVIRRAPCGKTQYYSDIKAGTRTTFLKVSNGRAAGKPEHESEIEDRGTIAGLTDSQRRNLVDMLHAARREGISAEAIVARAEAFIRSATTEKAAA